MIRRAVRGIRTPALAVAVLAIAGGVVSPARAAEHDGTARPLEQAREGSGVRDHPATRFALPAGELRLSSAEVLATGHQTLRFTVTLDRPVVGGRLVLTLPARWAARSGVSDIPFARGARGDRTVELAFAAGAPGDTQTFELQDVGIPAGTYAVPYRWSEATGATAQGSATVIYFAPVREGTEPSNPWTRLGVPGLEVNATNDQATESETFVTAVPGDRRRFVVGANGGGGFNAWITNDEGQSFTRATMPSTVDAPAEATPENADVCCDPMSAADALGNVWYGGLSLANGSLNPSRIVVNRLAPGATSFQPQTVGLPARTTGTQDKPMMTIDNSPSSPTFGRLYVVWGEPNNGGVTIAISQCDTRPGGTANAANCDNADNWSAPVSVTPTIGSYIYADVAVGPAGRVYVVWWDYSAANAIRGAVCNGATGCAATAAWSAVQTVASLDSTGGSPVPFACPIVAQPGGRAAPGPQVDVDRSGGPNDGRVYVTWGDLRPGSGTTRCADTVTPAATHLTWDAFVASAAGGLPGTAGPSGTVGSRLLTDGEGGGQPNSDEWFPWLAVDQTTGQAWADFYSTRDDGTRRTTNFYVRSVTPSGTAQTLGALNRVSSAPSDYSNTPCCTFGNDYGDYTGLDATQGVPIPVWSDKRGGLDGEAFSFVEPLSATASAITSAATTAATAAATAAAPVSTAPVSTAVGGAAPATTSLAAALGSGSPDGGVLSMRFGTGHPRIVGVTRRGVVVLRRPLAICPAGTLRCSLTTRARGVLSGSRPSGIGSSRAHVVAGRSVRPRFVLTERARRVLARHGTLRVAIGLVGRHATRVATRTVRVTLVAP